MWKKLPGPILISLIAVVGAATALRTDWATPLATPFTDGETQSAIEDVIDEALVIRERSIEGWAAARFALFGEGLDGVVPGRHGWLFSDEEYRVDPGFEATRQASVRKIADAVARLDAKGVPVVVALLPDKARIMSDQLLRPRPAAVEARYQRTRADLADAGIPTLDLEAVLKAARSGHQVFLRTDTHWTPQGARAVAQALGPLLREYGPHTEFDTVQGPDIQRQGDLLVFLDTGPFASALGLGDEAVSHFETVAAARDDTPDANALFADTSVPATLVGTSYSAISDWNFLGFLKAAAKLDILNRSTEGAGPFAPMDSFLEDLDAGTTLPQVVIWEIPERYLNVEP